MKLKNVSEGPRGVYVGGNDETKDVGTLLVLQPGATSEDVELSPSQLALARKTEWFDISGAGSRAKAD
ncbi:hypothetical protein [Sphingomonas abaci]|uniref:Uncharacterized protein n=1 Tax=Sphingomonas abaci TaxID=237611 RepID=A0A7W7AH58_9SPHN|nr:hypothetical protein [Sphingomonas abaci]MBB4616915.1 hypothetical protein [Sphingomonas abaci]